jgi:two-component system, NarL family, sensor histidine kinase EvgS
MKLGIRLQLLLLFGLLLLTGASIITLDEISQYRTRQAQHVLKDQSLAGLRRIMAVSDAYGMGIVDTVFKVRQGSMGWQQAQSLIGAAVVRIDLHWAELLKLPRTAQQEELFAQTATARVDADRAIEKLRGVLLHEDADALARFADTDLYAVIDPVTTRLRYLSDLLMIETEAVVREDVERTFTVSLARLGISLLTLTVIVLIGRRLLQNVYQGVESLVQLAHDMRERRFDAEPRYLPRGELGEVVDAFLVMRTEVRRYAHELQVTLESNDEVRRWLQERDLFQRSLLSAAQTAILSVDAAGRYTHVNPFAEKLLGYRAEQLIGAATPDRLHDRDELDAVAAELAGSGEAHGDWRLFLSLAEQRRPAREWTLVRADGSRVPVLLGVSAMTSSSGELVGLLFVATDLTDIKQLENELRLSESRAREASRAKSAFLAAMSHEIRTPMIGVTGMVEVLGHTRLDEEQRRALNVIQHSADSLLQIIGDILDFSKIEAGRMDLSPVTVSLHALLTATVYTFTGAASSKGLTLDYQIDASVARAHRVDAGRLRQILGNFLSNALKFTERGSIRLGLRLLDDDDGEQQRLEFTVTDTGIGISAAACQRLFEPFTQAEADTTRRYGGTGLGLAISRRLAELMGGEIALDSEPGVGTTARLRLALPLGNVEDIDGGEAFEALRADAFTPRPLPEPADAEREGSLLLLVDDHPTNRQVIARQLALAGFVCDTAEDGEQGLAQWLSGRYALVLTDVHMPKKDGYELARAIRQIEARDGLRRTPIVAVTAAAMKGEAERCLAAGMDDYLTKPVTVGLLLERLRLWLPHLAPAASTAAVAASDGLPQADRPPPLDPRVLADISAGDPAVERDVLFDFMDTTRQDIDALQRIQGGGDAPGVGRQAHKIKGAARLVGAVELAAAAEALETAGRAGELGRLRALQPDLSTAYERLRLHLAQRYPLADGEPLAG